MTRPEPKVGPKDSPKAQAHAVGDVLAYLDSLSSVSITELWESWHASRPSKSDTAWAKVLRAKECLKVLDTHGIAGVVSLLQEAEARGWKGIRANYVPTRKTESSESPRGEVWSQLEEADS